MWLQAGFAEIEITPPLGTHKIGWLKKIISTEVLSPLYARVAVFRTKAESVAFVQLDTLFIAWPEVAAIRQGVAQAYGYPGAHVMVSATHNHAGPGPGPSAGPSGRTGRRLAPGGRANNRNGRARSPE